MPRTRKPKSQVKRSDEVPEVYRDMLAEAGAVSSAHADNDGRRVKRRRVGGRVGTKSNHDAPADTIEPKNSTVDEHDELSDLFEEAITQEQSIVKTESEHSASSDQEDWEEVDLKPQRAEQSIPDPARHETEEFNLVLEIDGDAVAHARRKGGRKPLTSAEKQLRLQIHKMHVCCLLAHVFLRNHFCNDGALYKDLRRMLTKKNISYLNPSEDLSQFERSRSFMSGLEQVTEVFRTRYKISSRGTSRPFWAESADALGRSQPPEDGELPMMKEDFRVAGQQFRGSRDVGAQLFCALLRSAGVDSRLVCSLQVLPLNFNVAPAPTVQPSYATYFSEEQMRSRRSKYVSGCPVYWVEAFNEAVQKWVPVDPLVTKSIAKPSKFEPFAGDQDNKMTYVIGFEDDGSAHDVTRRYAQAYNAKTRRDRVESTDGGDKWWRRAMRLYQRHYNLNRDQVDAAELSKKEAAEPMPRNVQDFKYHPYYALERHLRRNEVIHPKREVGKVGAGRSGGHALLEPIFRRQDVHRVQSADKWYRTMGREIKLGEQPLKRVPARRARNRSAISDDEAEENAETTLYAMHQTKPYTAPPVVDRRIPKNIYGNIDIYVPTMIPPGGSHIKHPDTIRAAKILGIDFAAAVTGFVFRGRHGTAVFQGAIVAHEHYDAVEAVLSTLDDERIQAEEAQKSREALRMWKRFLAGLRIRERIEGYAIEGERDAVEQERSQTDEDANEEYQSDQGGGFFPAQEAEDFALPTASRTFQQQAPPSPDENEGGGFVVNDIVKNDGNAALASDQFLDNVDDDDGGGFLVEDDHDENAEEALGSSKEVDVYAHRVPPTVPSPRSPHIVSGEQKRIRDEMEVSIGKDDDKANEFKPGRGLSQAELDEAHLLQKIHESKQPHPRPSHKEDPAPAEEIPLSPVDVAATTSPIRLASTAPSEIESPESDKGSLLSEDPEDEDADPDWLV